MNESSNKSKILTLTVDTEGNESYDVKEATIADVLNTSFDETSVSLEELIEMQTTMMRAGAIFRSYRTGMNPFLEDNPKQADLANIEHDDQ